MDSGLSIHKLVTPFTMPHLTLTLEHTSVLSLWTQT